MDGDPSVASPNDGRDPPEKTCERCGAEIETSDWYPVVKERDSAGSLRFYPFCGEECREVWRDERRE